MSKLFASIYRICKSGQDPVISLNLGMLVVPEPKKPGRKKKPKAEPTEIQRAAQPVLGDKARPKCLNPHCRKRLKAAQKQAHVCNEWCQEQALIAYQAVVDLLTNDELPAEEVPDVQDLARRSRIDPVLLGEIRKKRR